jgi:hypothetical protein
VAVHLSARPDDRAGPRPGGGTAPGLIPLTRWGQVLAANERQLHRNNSSAAHPSVAANHPKALLLAALRPRNLPAGPGRFQGSGTNALLQAAKPFDPTDRYQVGQLVHAAHRVRQALQAATATSAAASPAAGLRSPGAYGVHDQPGPSLHTLAKFLLPEVPSAKALFQHPETIAQGVAEEAVPGLHILAASGIGPKLANVGVPDLSTRRPGLPQPKAASLFGVDLAGPAGIVPRFLGQAVEAAVGAPAGAAMLVAHPEREAKAYAHDYAERYGPLVHGKLGTFLHQFSQQPLAYTLDAGALADAAARLGIKTGAVKAPPQERELNLPGTEGHVQPFASPAPLTRAAQHRIDRLSEKHPDVPVVGAEARVAHAIPHEAARNFERVQQPSLAFQTVEAKLGPRLKTAYDVLHAGGHLEPVKALHLLDEEIKTRAARLADTSTPFIERAHQMSTLTQLKLARPFVERYAQDVAAGRLTRPSQKLRAALREGVPLANEGQRLRIELGKVSPEAAAERVHQRARLVTGGEYRETRLSRSLVDARGQVERLQRRVDKLTGRRDVEANKLLTREQTRAFKTVTGKPVPHDIGSAQQELARLEKFHEAQMNKLIEARVGKFSDLESRRETMLRNRARTSGGKTGANYDPLFRNEDAGSGRFLPPREGIAGGVHVPTLKEEARAHVEQELEHAIAKNAGHPAVKRITERLNRIAQLREGLRAAQDIQHGLGEHVEADLPVWAKQDQAFLADKRERIAELDRAGRNPNSADYRSMFSTAARGDFWGKGKNLREDALSFLDRTSKAMERKVSVWRRETAGHAEARNLTAPEASKLLGHREAGKVPEQVQTLRTALKQAQAAGDMKAETKFHNALDKLGYNEPGLVGANVLARGKVLQPRYSAELSRVGGALSVAKDRVQRLEQRHVERYGFLPEKREAGVVGGENAGAGAAYVGDRPNAVSRGVGRARTVTGKAAKQSYERRSRGILFSQGRASRSSKNVLRDFVQTARSVARAKDVEKAATFSTPVNPDGSLSAAHRYFNPQGLKVPLILKNSEEELGQMFPREVLQAARDEHDRYVRDVFPTERSNPTLVGSRAFRQAVKEGRVRQIPERIAAAFEGAHDLPLGFTEARGLKPLLAVLDTGNELTKAGLLYLKGSFVPANFAGNVVFGVVQQGPWFFKNLARSSAWLSHLSPETLRWIDSEVGSGASLSLVERNRGPLGAVTHKMGEVSNVLADRLPRRASIIHELAKRGYKTDAEITRLREAVAKGAPRATRILNQVSQQAEEAMVRFRGLGRTERQIISRAIFIWPWVRGASRYLGRLPLDRPLSADVVGQLGSRGDAETKRILGKLVSFLEGISPAGKIEQKLGTDLLPVRNFGAVTPFGTGAQTLQIAEGVVKGVTHGTPAPAAFALGSLAQPVVQSLIEGTFGRDTQTGAASSWRTAFGKLLGSMPLERIIQTATRAPQTEPFTGSPAHQRLYVQEGGVRAAVDQFFLGSARKRLLNVPAEQARAHAEDRATMSKVGRARDDIASLVTTIATAAKQTKLDRLMLTQDGKLQPGLASSVAALAERKLNRIEWAKTNSKRLPLSGADAVAADAAYLVRHKQLTADQAKRLVEFATKAQATLRGRRYVSGTLLEAIGARYFDSLPLKAAKQALGKANYELRVPSP